MQFISKHEYEGPDLKKGKFIFLGVIRYRGSFYLVFRVRDKVWNLVKRFPLVWPKKAGYLEAGGRGL